MAGRKIIIVDDDTVVRKLLEAFLTKEGYQVSVACDGEEGLGRIREAKPDAVILDVKMPKMDGYEVLAALKRDETVKDIPVIMVSSMEMEGDIQKGMSLGAAHYLTKPVQNDALLECIKAVLR